MRATTVLLALLGFFSAGWCHSLGGPAGYAGEPPESRTCAACHRPTASAPSLPNLGPGQLQLLGLPADYQLGGAVVDGTIVLSEPGKVRWGFELVAIGRNRQPGGTIQAPQFPEARFVGFVNEATGAPPLSYLTHTLTGTQWSEDPEDIGGPVYWNFRWRPPQQYTVGDIIFYLTAVTSDANGLPTGDQSYAASVRVSAPPDLSGDLSGDGRITFLDYFLFSLRWRNTGM